MLVEVKTKREFYKYLNTVKDTKKSKDGVQWYKDSQLVGEIGRVGTCTLYFLELNAVFPESAYPSMTRCDVEIVQEKLDNLVRKDTSKWWVPKSKHALYNFRNNPNKSHSGTSMRAGIVREKMILPGVGPVSPTAAGYGKTSKKEVKSILVKKS